MKRRGASCSDLKHYHPIAGWCWCQDGENKPLGGAPEAGKTAASGRERARSSLSPKEKDAQAGKYCWLCAFQFTLFKRQHHCRLCDASCCDECGKKKAVVDGKEVRCCDACYNYLSSQVRVCATVRPGHVPATAPHLPCLSPSFNLAI